MRILRAAAITLVGSASPAAQEPGANADCASCHAEIHAEWAASLHGQAWIDPIYQDAQKKATRPESCWPCHIPEPLVRSGLGKLPVARAENRDAAIHCDACHLDEDAAYRGPFGGPASAHASVADPLFSDLARSNELCETCHSTRIGPVLPLGQDFRNSTLPAEGKSCVGCHMDPVERAMATDSGLPAPPPTRRGRSHTLLGPRDPTFAAKTFALEVRAEPDVVVLVLRNETGHRVPGLVGREFRVKIALLDGTGSSLSNREEVIDARAYVPVSRAREIRLERPRGARAVRVVIVCRHLDRTETAVLEETRDF